MKQILIKYSELDFPTLVKIFELADLLGTTPTEAARVYLIATCQSASNAA